MTTPAELDATLLAAGAVREWLPKGRQVGSEWLVGSLRGEEGDSLRVNLDTGTWLSFADGNAGPGPVSLYAAMHNIPHLEAASRLSRKVKPNGTAHQTPVEPHQPEPPLPAATALIAPQPPTGDAGLCLYCRTPLIAGGYEDYCNIRCALAAKPELAKPKPAAQPVAQAQQPQQQAVNAPALYTPAVDLSHRGKPTGRPALAVIEGGKARQPVSRMMHWQELGLYLGDKGMPAMNIDNLERLIANHPELQGRFWYDSFHRTIYTTWNGPQREFEESDCLHLTSFLQRECELTRLTDELAWKGVTSYSFKHVRNECHEWLTSLQWDGVPRIDGFLHAVCGADDSRYTLDVSRMFWLSMVARICDPGCKFDNMVILEGPQGSFKSTLLQTIGGKYYRSSGEQIGTKDFLLNLSGVMLMELSELTSLNKIDANVIKKILSDPVDTYRAPYGRKPAKYPRTCVFVGTTNEARYLRDETGNRRFWPIACSGLINIQLATKEREQYFAEAMAVYSEAITNGGRRAWYAEPHEAKHQQSERMTDDIWQDTIREWLTGRTETTVREIASQCLQIDTARHDDLVKRRIGRVLRMAGWDWLQVRRGGSRTVVWRSPDYQARLSDSL